MRNTAVARAGVVLACLGCATGELPAGELAQRLQSLHGLLQRLLGIPSEELKA